METLEEYSFVGLSGNTYHPAVENGKWFLISKVIPVDFLYVVYLCKIPDEDAALLKLKYGANQF